MNDSPVQLPPYFRDNSPHEIRASGLPYHLADQKLPEHWPHTHRGHGVRVGIADTGIDADHPELRDKIVAGRSFVRRDSADFHDGNDHGTHVAGIIAANTVGVAPDCEIVVAKVLANNGSGSNAGVAAGIRYLAAEGCHIINLSLGSPYDDPATRDAIAEAQAAGVLVFAATGNERASHVSYPARHCIAVGAVGRDMNLAYFSNRGKAVDLVGYGVGIYSTIPGGRYQTMSGTSMATPYIVGLAANRLSAELAHAGQILTRSTDDLLKLETFVVDLGPAGRDTSYGRGFPDLPRALYENINPPDQAPDQAHQLPSLVVTVATADGRAYAPATVDPVQ